MILTCSSSCRCATVAALLCAGAMACTLHAQTGLFTFQIGTPPLVRHDDLWRFHVGTNAPPPGWQTNHEVTLGTSWGTGPGGFGYDDGDDATDLTVMYNRASTLYIRKTFVIGEAIDPSRRLELTVDYDDGFVAYLDGVEVARSPNVQTSVGVEPAFNAVTRPGANHEALGYRGLAVDVFDLGEVGSRLQPGTHVLAVLGINSATTSSDFSLIADLRVPGGADVSTEGGFFSLVASNTVLLSGSNTMAGALRVAVNGVDASFVPGSGEWSHVQPLVPGMNRLYAAALDASGAVLVSVSRDIVSETASTCIGGVLAGDATWNVGQGIVRVTNALTVPAGVTLSVAPGVVVLLEPEASILAQAGGAIRVTGSGESPVWFLPADGATTWGELSASGANSELSLHFAEVVNGQVRAATNAVATVEDSVLRDFVSEGVLFVSGASAQQMTLRRTHLARYDQCRFSQTPLLIEDCLVEHVGSDATDVADQPDVVIRRTTYRFGTGTGTDAIDNGGCPRMRVESCLVHDFPDKGVSIAALSHGTVVRNTLVYHAAYGISVYSASNCVFEQNTLVSNTTGIAAYVRSGFPGPGLAAATNTIVWDNATNIHLAGGGAITAAYCDIEGTNYPGFGNLSLDPRFLDPALHDYRLAPDSPVRFAGAGDADMGVLVPVGGMPPAPFDLAAHAPGTNAIQLAWQEDADNECGFEIQRSTNAIAWQPLAGVGPNTRAFTDLSAAIGQPYFYRVRATNGSGLSRFSNLAAATRQPPVLLAGGTLPGDTVWSPAAGTVLVVSPVVVPEGITLRIEPGTVVRLTNRAGLRATSGGAIDVAGAPGAQVVFTGANPQDMWGGLSAVGTDASLVVRHAEIQGGCVGATNATLLLEDCYLHDYKDGGYAIGGCENAVVTVRGCHFRTYHETLWRGSLVVIEDSLFEYADNSSSDALDFDGVLPGSTIRRCTFRHGPQTNTDAIDLGPGLGHYSVGVAILDTLMYDFPHDGGISAGEGVWGLTVSNCLIYGCRGAIKGKETGAGEFAEHPTTMGVYQSTVVDNLVAGYSNFLKTCSTCLAGKITNSYNNIVYGNPIDIVLLGQGTLDADHTLFGSTNVVGNGTFTAGPGVLVADPLFVNAALRDYRLQPNSPALHAGRSGEALGCRFPVGAPMAASHPSIESLAVTGATARIRFWADCEKSYTLQGSPDLSGSVWTTITNIPLRSLPALIEVNESLTAGHRYYRLTTP
ncbi:MAG: right-handed parallel beta-helix repeat-containing protein [Verrucomicrobia bacterium]|nr:right-handed parallel beta-helix repeat-containing protein [Verrucomicrobiota bacterium]